MIYTQRGLDWAMNFIDEINADPSKYVIYKQSRPIANLKHMMVTTTDLYPGNTAFKMKFPGDKVYTDIPYIRVLEEMNALGTALIARGLKDKRIAICGENCYYWCLSYLTAVCGVGVVSIENSVGHKPPLLNGHVLPAADNTVVVVREKHYRVRAETLQVHSVQIGAESVTVRVGAV